MNNLGDEPRPRGALYGKPSSLQDKIAQFYYAHGLFCSSYPAILLSIAIFVTLLSCYPLLNLPLPGKDPLQTWTTGLNLTSNPQPFCYVQQVVLKTSVLPWGSDLHLGDAFRAPLYESFKLLEVIRNYQNEHNDKTLGHLCLHVEAVRKRKAYYANYLPQYSCLVLSPANFWQQDVQQFAQDNSLLTTIFNQHNFQKGKTSIAEMLFGMKLFDTGIKRYPLRNRFRIIQFAVTMFFKEYDAEYINGLRHKLQQIYPLHQNLQNQTGKYAQNDTLLIQYPGEINLVEFIPISLAFLLLFLYFYFSVRKIDLIHSKFGMAFASVVTVCGSLSMTYGLCFFFGLTLNLGGKVIFPYLVLLVGLENVLCLTKSVAVAPLHLDVKIRIAQGLSKEGWSITKNLLLELTILTFGIFTFVAVIQEFCIFAVVGLVTDYFMQMVFFATILGIDIQRQENQYEKTNSTFRSSLYQSQNFYDKSSRQKSTVIRRSKSHPRLSTFPANIVAGQAQGAQEVKIPKRLRLVNLWTRTRFFHRSFMVLMIVWISNITYNSGLIEHYILNNNYFHQEDGSLTKTTISSNNKQIEQNHSTIKLFPLLNTNNSLMNKVNYVTHSPLDYGSKSNDTNDDDDVDRLKPSDYSPWMKLSTQHWISIVRKYNLTLSGNYIAILPNIKLAHVISPEQAVLLRNPNEKYGDKFQWQALAAALDPFEYNGQGESSIPQSEQPYYPTSVFAIILITILCIISVIVLAYTFVVLYRCICSRNYAEWRASWFSEKTEEITSEDPVLLEAVPVILEGHQQEIECIATDGVGIVSGCLDGQLKIWDSATGELLASIDRKSHFENGHFMELLDNDGDDDDNSSDYESGSPPDSSSLYFPVLKRRINTNFSTNKDYLRSNSYDAKVDFAKAFREFYVNHNNSSSHHHDNNRMLCNSKRVKQRTKDKSKKDSFSSECSNSNQNLNLSKTSLDSDKSEIINNAAVKSTTNNANITNSNELSPIWCIDYMDNLIVIGCANGRLEFWDGQTGQLKCIFEDGSQIGISTLKIIGSRIVASRLYGTLDLFQLQTYSHGRHVDWNFSCAYRRTHIRTGSVGSVPDNLITSQNDDDDDLHCLKILTIKAHQQPITCLECEGGRILTGSQDHTLKVFRLDDGSPQYTLHGHCGPITCLFIDRISPSTSASGSQDGMLCVWDLLTGACMYNIQAHDGSITSLTYSASYIISLGADDRMCVWERFQGHLLQSIFVSQTFSSQLLMLAPHLVVAARSGQLVIWDVRSGECVRNIVLGRSPFVFIKQLILLRDAVLCDYGNQLRIVRFPLITHKFD